MKIEEPKIKYDDYHLRQYDAPYRSTVSFTRFLESRIPEACPDVLDLGCGAGANGYWIKRQFPNWKIVGIDIDGELVGIAKEKNRCHDDVKFLVMDALEIDRCFPAASFDYSLAVQFINFVDFDFPVIIQKLLPLVRRGIFLTGLFSEGPIEQYTTAHDLQSGWQGLYKIYSLSRFSDVTAQLSAAAGRKFEIEVEAFEMDIDLPKPEKPAFGTYTMRLQSGDRLQVSGYMLMPWYNVFIRLK